jgi:hypothetical protein
MTSRPVAPFLQKLWDILADKKHAAIVSWEDTGETFEVKRPSAFSAVVLPKYFKHGKFSSFQRQLNYFGFRKIVKSSSEKDEPCRYSHESFRAGHPEDISKIRRKTNHRASSKDQTKSSSSECAKARAKPPVCLTGSSSAECAKPPECLTGPSSAECAQPPELKGLLHEGYLQIQNYKAWSGWSKKYFVLEGAVVKWYAGRADLDAEGVERRECEGSGEGYEEGRADLNADTKTYKQEGVAEPRVMYVMTNGRSLVLRAANQQEMMLWLNAFKNNIGAMRHVVPSVKPEHNSDFNQAASAPLTPPADDPGAQWQYTQDHLQMLMDVDMADDQQSFPPTAGDGETRRDTGAGLSDSFEIMSGINKGVGSRSFHTVGLGDCTREAPSHSLDISVLSSVLPQDGIDNESVSGLSTMESMDGGEQADNMSQSSDGLSGLSDISDLSYHLRRITVDDIFAPTEGMQLQMPPLDSARVLMQQQHHQQHANALALPLTPKQDEQQETTNEEEEEELPADAIKWTMEQRGALEEFYRQQDPSKLGNIDRILDVFSPAELEASLNKKYGYSPSLIQRQQPLQMTTENSVEFGKRKANFWKRWGGSMRRKRNRGRSTSPSRRDAEAKAQADSQQQPFPLMCQDGVFKFDAGMSTISQAEFYGQTQAALSALSAAPVAISLWQQSKQAAFAPSDCLPVAIPLIKCDSTDSQGSASKVPVAMPITPNGTRTDIKMEHHSSTTRNSMASTTSSSTPPTDTVAEATDMADSLHSSIGILQAPATPAAATTAATTATTATTAAATTTAATAAAATAAAATAATTAAAATAATAAAPSSALRRGPVLEDEAVPSLDDSSMSDDNSAGGRGGYKCGKCGQPKAGHVCLFSGKDVLVRSASTQCDLSVTCSPCTQKPQSEI